MSRLMPGLKSRFTHDELEAIRAAYNEWQRARIARIRVCKNFGLRSDTFNKIGQGRLGKNPRAA